MTYLDADRKFLAVIYATGIFCLGIVKRSRPAFEVIFTGTYKCLQGSSEDFD